MSVSSERSCLSPPGSASSVSSDLGSSYCGSGGSTPLKLKRRWIEMSSVDEELHSKENLLPPALQALQSSCKRPKHSPVRIAKSGTATGFKTPMSIYTELNSRAPKRPIKYTLPEDPRDWTKKDVLTWLRYMTSTYDLEVSPAKFDMNGKALCLMNMEMFVKRVPTGGKLMYRDFRLRLYPAVFFQEKPKPDYSKLTPLEMLALTTGKYFS